MRESQRLETHLKRRRGFTGTRMRIVDCDRLRCCRGIVQKIGIATTVHFAGIRAQNELWLRKKEKSKDGNFMREKRTENKRGTLPPDWQKA